MTPPPTTSSSGGFPERFGRYTLLEHVAIGGMAEILLAIEDGQRRDRPRRFVTIKRILPDYALDPDYIEFFVSEGLVSLRCSHPNLPKAFELNTVGATPYLAMEYIRGHTLLQLIQAAHRQFANISVSAALHVFRSVCSALVHLHNMRTPDGTALRVVHRDVTPQNILIDASGTVRLIDLGIARSGLQVHLTQAGVMKGKTSYMAPEQLAQKRTIDHRADLFSLGVVMHELLTTCGLFTGSADLRTMQRIRKQPIPKLSSFRTDVPEALEQIIGKALAPRAKKRFQTAEEILVDLDALASAGIAESSQPRLRDETLRLCGDPPVPRLGGASFGVVRSLLKGEPDQKGEPEADTNSVGPKDDKLDLDYFLARCANRSPNSER